MRKPLYTLLLLATTLPIAAFAATATFEGLLPMPDAHFDPTSGPVGPGSFSSGGVSFGYEHEQFSYEFEGETYFYSSWKGFSYSTETSTANTPFSESQYASAAGGSSSGSGYAVLFTSTESTPPFAAAFYSLNFDSDVVVQSLDVTNSIPSVYLINTGSSNGGLTLQNGAFNGAEDFFTLQIYGVQNGLQGLTPVEFDLARNTSVVTAWETLDLSPLGTVDSLRFTFSWSDAFLPAYVALDNLTYTAVPEASSAAFVMAVLAAAGSCRRKA